MRAKASGKPLKLEIQPQPDDVTCGPTCLHAVYRALGDDIPLARVIDEIIPLPSGGTLAVNLACHALRRGYRSTIYTYNLNLFDPTWFVRPGVDLAERLRAQGREKRGARLRLETEAYLEYLQLGGELRYEELHGRLLRRYLGVGIPLLAGLSSTYLYDCAREVDHEEVIEYDDIRGEPTGHFVVLHGYNKKRRVVNVADPYHENPAFERHYYEVGVERLIGAILLGILTYDANLLVLEPPDRKQP